MERMSDDPLTPTPASAEEEPPVWLQRLRARRAAERAARPSAPPDMPPESPPDDEPAWLKDLAAPPEGDTVPPWLAGRVRAQAGPAARAETTAPDDDEAAEDQHEPLRQRRVRRRRERRARGEVKGNVMTGTITSLAVVVAAAVMVATIFTFWTPVDLFSDAFREGMRLAYATISAAAPPTPVPTPIWMRRVGVVSGHRGPHPSTGRADPGAVCEDGLTEAEINFTVARLVVQELSGRGYTVELLDEWDPRLEGYQASALISIHTDSCYEFQVPGATGFKVAPPAARNAGQGATNDERLRDCLIEHYGAITGLPLHPSVTRDMTEYHTFGEISSLTPAAIIEIGFMFEDRQILTEQPDLLARGIIEGLLCFLEAPPPTPLPELTPWPTVIATPTPLETPGPS